MCHHHGWPHVKRQRPSMPTCDRPFRRRTSHVTIVSNPILSLLGLNEYQVKKTLRILVPQYTVLYNYSLCARTLVYTVDLASVALGGCSPISSPIIIMKIEQAQQQLAADRSLQGIRGFHTSCIWHGMARHSDQDNQSDRTVSYRTKIIGPHQLFSRSASGPASRRSCCASDSP